MEQELSVYMDCCCLNRPYDDQTQDKILIESNAIMAILYKCFYGPWKLIGSDIVEYEIMKTPDINKRNNVFNLYNIKNETIFLNEIIQKRAFAFKEHGLKPLDSLHLASAEYRNVDILLTVDKDFLKISKQIVSSVKAANPLNWYMEVIAND